MFTELSRGELTIAATYVLAGILIAVSALTDPSISLSGGLLTAFVLVSVPPIVLRDIVATKRLAALQLGHKLPAHDD